MKTKRIEADYEESRDIGGVGRDLKETERYVGEI